MKLLSTFLGVAGPLLLLGTKVFGGCAEFLARETTEALEYRVPSPASIQEQLETAMNRLESESLYLLGEDVDIYAPISDELWAAIENFHRLSFTALVYAKVGLYGANRGLEEAWFNFIERFLYGGASPIEDLELIHPRHTIIRATMIENGGLHYVECGASHSIGDERLRPLLSIMSVLVGKRLQAWLRSRRVAEFIRHSAQDNPSYTRNEVRFFSENVKAMRNTLRLCGSLQAEYELARQQAALSLNDQAILEVALQSFLCRLTNFWMDQMGWSDFIYANYRIWDACGLKEQREELAFLDSPEFLRLKIPEEEKLRAVWKSQHHVHMKKPKWLRTNSLQSPDCGIQPTTEKDPATALLEWWIQNKELARDLRFESFSDDTYALQGIRQWLGREDATAPLKPTDSAIDRMDGLSAVLKQIERALASAESYLPHARQYLMSRHCFDSCRSRENNQNIRSFCDTLEAILAPALQTFKASLKFFREACIVPDEGKREEFYNQLSNLQAKFDPFCQRYNAIVSEVELLPLWSIFPNRWGSLPLVFAETAGVKSSRNAAILSP